MAGREENCSAGGGGGDTEAHFPNPPLLGRRDGRGGSGPGCPTCRAGGGGGVNPTSMAQNDTHVALIILTTQIWGGGGGELLVEKTFSGQNLCSCAFGANIRCYTKQRARHGTPFPQPPPSFGGGGGGGSPPPAEQFSGRPVTGDDSSGLAPPPPPPPTNRWPEALWRGAVSSGY